MSFFIGESAWTHAIEQTVARVARSNSTALIMGPSGTGKELIARSIHQQSQRADNPFVVVDCTWIPTSLFPSQLFGHVKGAFSGAEHDALGCFRAAQGGTIFLDEIGELSLELQTQMLRAIQERVVTPVGSHRGVHVDVRIIAATNRDLKQEVAAGRFRLDLFYRLNVVALRTQPLSARPEDIEPLASHFLARLAVERGGPRYRLSAKALRLLQTQVWPGNVRQLQNVLEQAVVFLSGDEISAEHVSSVLDDVALPVPVPQAGDAPNLLPFPSSACCGDCGSECPAAASGSWPTLAECEQCKIRAALERVLYNISAAARLLQVDRRLLVRKARKYGLLPLRHHLRAA